MQKIDNKIDGEVLMYLTERALETLIPVIGHRMKFLQLLEKLKLNKQEEKTDDSLLVVAECGSDEEENQEMSQPDDVEIRFVYEQQQQQQMFYGHFLPLPQ